MAIKNILIDIYKLQIWLGSMELSILRLCRMAFDGLHNRQERVVPSAVAPLKPTENYHQSHTHPVSPDSVAGFSNS